MSEPTAAVSALGFGAAAIGNLYRAVDDATADATVAAALAAGIEVFDTAPHYGFGLSERRLGEALARHDPLVRARVFTKAGRRLTPIDTVRAATERHGFVQAEPFESVFDYGYDAVMHEFEGSLRRLRRERVDILFAHDLGSATHGEAHLGRLREFMEGGYRAMRELKDAGVVGAIGLGVNEWQVCEEVLAGAELDVVLLAGRYTLLEQGAVESFLPLCAMRGVRVLVGGPFNSGILAQGVRSGAALRYNYGLAPAFVVERVGRLERVCERFGVDLAAAALQFPLAHPQVVGVVAGLASPAEVAEAARRLQTSIPAALWDALRSEGLVHLQAPTPAPVQP